MQSRNNTFPFPIPLLILDFIGTLLAALGLYEMVGGSPVVPESFRFGGYDAVLIGVGFLMILPFVLHIVRSAGEKRREG